MRTYSIPFISVALIFLIIVCGCTSQQNVQKPPIENKTTLPEGYIYFYLYGNNGSYFLGLTPVTTHNRNEPLVIKGITNNSVGHEFIFSISEASLDPDMRKWPKDRKEFNSGMGTLSVESCPGEYNCISILNISTNEFSSESYKLVIKDLEMSTAQGIYANAQWDTMEGYANQYYVFNVYEPNITAVMQINMI